MYTENDWWSYLAHHGISGQKWGDRHGPPYPLNKETSRKIQSEGQRKKYLKERDQANRISSGKRKLGKFVNVGTAALTSDHDDVWEEMLTTQDNNEWLRDILHNPTKTHFTYQNYTSNGKQEHLASTTDIIHELYEQTVKAHGGDDFSNIFSSERKDLLTNAVTSMGINPDYGKPGTTNNCSKNSFASELIRRGITGISAGRQSFPASADAMSYWFDGATKKTFFGSSKAAEEIDSYGDESSGSLNVRASFGGHCVHWTNWGNSFSIEDGQCGKVYEGNDFKDAYSKFSNDQGWNTFDTRIDITRLDNCDINWANAAEDGCLRGNKVWNHETKKIVDTW